MEKNIPKEVMLSLTHKHTTQLSCVWKECFCTLTGICWSLNHSLDWQEMKPIQKKGDWLSAIPTASRVPTTAAVKGQARTHKGGVNRE